MKESIVVYSDGTETFICLKSREKEMLKEYFKDASRDPEDFDCSNVNGVIAITSQTLIFLTMERHEKHDTLSELWSS